MQKLSFAAAIIGGVLVGASAHAAIIFDNFNTDAGHFGYNPTFSSTSNVGTTSTSTRMASDGFDALGALQVDSVMAATTPARSRVLSGGPPYNTANGGAPVGNTSFTVTNGVTDGFIGLYAKTSDTGMTISINLDQPGNTGGLMTGGVPKALTADGQWHLYEWNLDATSDWGAVAGIGGTNANLEGFSHTIDSVYIQGITGTAGTTRTVLLDFVAKSDSGSIAALVPEPSTGLFAAAMLAAGIRRRRSA